MTEVAVMVSVGEEPKFDQETDLVSSGTTSDGGPFLARITYNSGWLTSRFLL